MERSKKAKSKTTFQNSPSSPSLPKENDKNDIDFEKQTPPRKRECCVKLSTRAPQRN